MAGSWGEMNAVLYRCNIQRHFIAFHVYLNSSCVASISFIDMGDSFLWSPCMSRRYRHTLTALRPNLSCRGIDIDLFAKLSHQCRWFGSLFAFFVVPLVSDLADLAGNSMVVCAKSFSFPGGSTCRCQVFFFCWCALQWDWNFPSLEFYVFSFWILIPFFDSDKFLMILNQSEDDMFSVVFGVVGYVVRRVLLLYVFRMFVSWVNLSIQTSDLGWKDLILLVDLCLPEGESHGEGCSHFSRFLSLELGPQ